MIVLATPHKRYDLIHRVLEQNQIVFAVARNPVELVDTVRRVSPRYVFFPHWSWKIPPEIFEAHECVIFHMTDVPFGRGGSPLQNLIVRGFSETKISALRCAHELDAGPVYSKEPLSLEGTAEDILQRSAVIVASMIVEIVRKEPAPVPQKGQPTVFKRRGPDDGDLRPVTNTKIAYDYIRMLDAEGYPPAFIDTEDLRFEFSEAIVRDESVFARVRISKKPI